MGEKSDRQAPGQLSTIAEQARNLRFLLPGFVEELAAHIRRHVPAYASEDGSRGHESVVRAIEVAATTFLNSIDGTPQRDHGVNDLFYSVGRSEAHRFENLSAMRAALNLAGAFAWDKFRIAHQYRPTMEEARGKLADALFAYINHLTNVAEQGFVEESRLRAADRSVQRSKLAERLVAASNKVVLDDLDPGIWEPPSKVDVIVGRLSHLQPAEPLCLPDGSLWFTSAHHIVAIVDPQDSELAAKTMLDSCVRVAVSWSVPPVDITPATAWARRALRLVTKGIIAPEPIISCEQHRTQLWLQSEPALRQHLAQDLLGPLLAETPNSRQILSQTLLIWLETRDSAPAIATRLGVHAQTVRYRWKRIYELFGERLHEPDFVAQMTMLLKASLPMWQAGDESDFAKHKSSAK